MDTRSCHLVRLFAALANSFSMCKERHLRRSVSWDSLSVIIRCTTSTLTAAPNPRVPATRRNKSQAAGGIVVSLLLEGCYLNAMTPNVIFDWYVELFLTSRVTPHQMPRIGTQGGPPQMGRTHQKGVIEQFTRGRAPRMCPLKFMVAAIACEGSPEE